MLTRRTARHAAAVAVTALVASGIAGATSAQASAVSVKVQPAVKPLFVSAANGYQAYLKISIKDRKHQGMVLLICERQDKCNSISLQEEQQDWGPKVSRTRGGWTVRNVTANVNPVQCVKAKPKVHFKLNVTGIGGALLTEKRFTFNVVCGGSFEA